MKSGLRTTELYVVLAVLAKLLGLDQWLSPQLLDTAQNQVMDLAAQLHQTGGDNTMAYLIALAYVAGRQILKWRNDHAK
jgi:hypothetical protein